MAHHRPGPAAAPPRPGTRPDSRDSGCRIEALFSLGVPVREKTLWTMLYETAARSSEVLALDIEDLDRRNRRSKVTRKGSAVDIIVWQTGTARLLPRLLDGRTRGPVSLTGRRARVALAAADLDPGTGRARLSYRRAEEIFTELTKPLAHPDITDPAQLADAPGWTLHDLRHSALTHAEVSGVASGASFGTSREHALPAAQRAALRCPRPAGPPRGCGDLGLHSPPGSAATMMQQIPLRGPHHHCACWHRDASGSSRLHRVHHRRPQRAAPGRHRSCEGRAGPPHHWSRHAPDLATSRSCCP